MATLGLGQPGCRVLAARAVECLVTVVLLCALVLLCGVVLIAAPFRWMEKKITDVL